MKLRFTLLIALAASLIAAAAAEDKPAKRPPWKTSRLVGSPEPPPPYKIVPAFPALKFEKPSCIEEIPGTGRLLVTEMSGKIFSFPNKRDIGRVDLALDLQQLSGGSVSLFDAEFHPQFKGNRFLFVCYVHPGEGNHTRVSRFTLTSDSPPTINPKSEQVIITWPSGGHNGGCLEFGKDGLLYISTGDGSGPNPPDGLTTGQDVSDLLGAILRIDVDRNSGEQAHAIPDDNPFAQKKGVRPEIWAYGLRNPWKFGIDPQSGDIFAADNGWESWEMVHKIVRGGNCGWPVMEGRASLRTEVKPGPTPILPPVKDHPHTEANSVIGGPVYRGSKLPALAGSFVYGDYITGTIWAIKPDKDNSYSCTTLCDTDLRIVAFTEVSSGELLVLDYDFTGQVYELVPSGLEDTSATFPRKLSETGLFKSLRTMEPAPGVVPYSVKLNRWMDGAVAERLVAIPGEGKIRLATAKGPPANYPEGTVLVNHVSLPAGKGQQPLRLETQILHYENGIWHPYSYLWDEEGKDASLVESIGASRQIAGEAKNAEGRTWHVNAVNECKMCHNAESGYVLGFVPQQLDDQLAGLSSSGVISNNSLPMCERLRLVDPQDANEKLDDRARSYLHVNCSMCHQPGGNAIVSFYLRRDLPFDKLNTNKGTGIGTFGMRDAKIIVPGDPYRSVLMYRMSKLGYARMPYIGSHVVDSRGVALIEEWIKSMPIEAGGTRSGPITAGSAEAKSLAVLQDSEGSPERKVAIRELLKTTEGALALALRMHSAGIYTAEESFVRTEAAALPSDRRGLFDTFIPESERRKTLGERFDLQLILNQKGDAERGKLIFFSDNARCRNCHELDDKEKSLGPTLGEIAKKYPRGGELLEHVLDPSKKIDEPLATWSVLTTDGRALSGLILEQSDKVVVLKTAEKQVVRLPREEIELLKKGDKSLMPDRILSDLTAQEAADLMEYIRSRSGDN